MRSATNTSERRNEGDVKRFPWDPYQTSGFPPIAIIRWPRRLIPRSVASQICSSASVGSPLPIQKLRMGSDEGRGALQSLPPPSCRGSADKNVTPSRAM